MPKLTEIARMTVAGKPVANAERGLYAYRRSLPQEELSIINKLRTSLNVGNADKITTFQQPAESNGIYASWRSELERTPKFDLCQKTPLNEVKDTTETDVSKLILDMKYQNWIQNVNERVKHIRFFK